MKEKIKNWLIKNWLKTAVIIVVLIVAGGGFYWYEWRPAQIRKECYKNASIESDIYWAQQWNQVYNVCLKEKGLEK